MQTGFSILQEKTTVDSSNTEQDPRFALDVSPYATLFFELEVVDAASGGTLRIQTANEAAEENFADLDGFSGVDLSSAAVSQRRSYDAKHGRFVRWATNSLSGSGTIRITVLGRG